MNNGFIFISSFIYSSFSRSLHFSNIYGTLKNFSFFVCIYFKKEENLIQ
ncbi:hypothetical protein B4134_1370 [Bacillus safensis]|nr:hypothetical protein B4134_1370 [Bacillus safensis]